MGLRYKYPRTPHLPWSEGATDDDRVLSDVNHFEGQSIVVTEKIDGENSNVYWNYYHARSIDSKHHASRTHMKQLQSTIGLSIPKDWRICGENVYAEHSIHYKNLPAYFLVFGIYNEKNESLAWDQVEGWCGELGLYTVPVLYKGIWNENIIRSLCLGKSIFDGSYAILNKEETKEGIVVRKAGSFSYDDFDKNVAKFVRKDHVTTDEHWLLKPVVPNELKA